MELKEETIEEIRKLTFDPDAGIVMPVDFPGTIYWTDEVAKNAFFLFVTPLEREQIQSLFLIRDRYWDTGTMGCDDQLYWEGSRTQFPHWPIFQRLELGAKQRKIVEVAKENREFLVEVVMSLADETEVRTEDGVEYSTAIFKRESVFKRTRKRWTWRFWR